MSTVTTSWILQLRDRITQQLRNVQGQSDQAGEAFDKAQARADSLGSSIKRAVAAYLSWQGLKGTIGAAAEFEQTNTAFEVLLGNAEKGRKLAAQITEMAALTPYNADVLQNAARTMLGFGVAQEQIMPNLKLMGDIAMGNAQKMDSLTLAFSQTSAAGKLTGLNLLQMINAGFNPLEEMSRKTGKSFAQLKEEMGKGLITAEQVREAFISATSAGGRYSGMMDKLAATTKGGLVTMTGLAQQFGIEFGQKLLPIVNIFINKGITFFTFLRQNITTIAKVAAGIGAMAVAIKVATTATALWAAKFTILSKVLAVNPIFAAIGLVAGLTTALIAFNKTSTTAAKVQRDFHKSLANTRVELDRDFLALRKTKEGTNERREAIENINNKYGEYLSNLLTEKSTLEDIAAAQDEATQAMIKNVALKTQKEKLENVFNESVAETNASFDRIIDKLSKKLGTRQAGELAPQVHDLINRIQNSQSPMTDVPEEREFTDKYDLRYGAFSTKYNIRYFDEIRSIALRRQQEQNKINQFFDGFVSGFNLNAPSGGKGTGGNGNGKDTGGNGNGNAGDGIKLGGSGGGGRAITMNVTINNHYNVSSQMDVTNTAESVAGIITDRLRDTMVTAGV